MPEGMENRVYWEIALLVLFLVSVAANSLALLVFCRRPGLRTISNRFVMNLLASNLVMCTGVAGAVCGERSADGAGGAVASWVAAAGDAGVAGGALAALLAVLLVALDQHHAVTDPLRCHTRLLQRRPRAMCAAAWAAAAVAAVARAAAATARRVQPRAPAAQAADLAAALVYLVLGVLAPAAGVCVMYARIYRAARSSGLRARAHQASALQLHEPPPLPLLVEETEHLTLKIDEPVDAAVPPDVDHKFGPFLLPPERPLRCPSVASLRNARRDGRSSEDLRRGLPAVSSAPSLAAPLLAIQPRPPQPQTNGSRITSIRCRISNASMFRYREESRALRVGLLAGALVLLHVPSALLAALGAASPALAPGTAHMAARAMLLLAGATAPFLFALRSRRVQREAWRMLLPSKVGGWARADAAAADTQRARAALELLRALSPGADGAEGADDATSGNAGEAAAARGSFSSGGSTQLSTASDE